jgi:hypothetical protein
MRRGSLRRTTYMLEMFWNEALLGYSVPGEEGRVGPSQDGKDERDGSNGRRFGVIATGRNGKREFRISTKSIMVWLSGCFRAFSQLAKTTAPSKIILRPRLLGKRGCDSRADAEP